MVTTPSPDPLSLLSAAAFALPCFVTGVIWTSDLGRAKYLVIFALLTIAFAIAATLIPHERYTITMLPAFGVANVYLGILAGRDIIHSRARIFLALGAGYSIGLMLFWPLLSVVLAGFAVLIADRSIALQTSCESDA
jgi:hypothetical protein